MFLGAVIPDDIEVVFYEEGGIVKQEGGLFVCVVLCNLFGVFVYVRMYVFVVLFTP